MKKKVQIPLVDVSTLTRRKLKKKYQILIQRNERTYKFSNQKKAQKFVIALENQITKDLNELTLHFSYCSKVNISLIKFCDYLDLKKLRSDLERSIDNYAILLNHPLRSSDILATYVSNMLYDVDMVYVTYKRLMRENNRLNYLYTDVISHYDAYLRLKKQVNNTLYNFEPISSKYYELIITKETPNLKIA